jgi:hypothetical protein
VTRTVYDDRIPMSSSQRWPLPRAVAPLCRPTPPGDGLCLPPQSVSAGLVLAPRAPPAGAIAKRHGRFPSDAHPWVPLRCRRLRVVFASLSHRASGAGSFWCAWACPTVRRRPPRRLSPAARVEGEGPWAALAPGARKVARAAGADRRVEARGVRKVGAGGPCASASDRRAAAASGCRSSQRVRPLQAAGAPSPRRPGRRSASLTATVCRPHPKRVAVSRGGPHNRARPSPPARPGVAVPSLSRPPRAHRRSEPDAETAGMPASRRACSP